MATKKNTVTYLGTGRRKTSVARVFMTPGKGNIVVNGKTLEEYLPMETLRMVVRSPLELTETLDQCLRWWIHWSGWCNASRYHTCADGSKR